MLPRGILKGEEISGYLVYRETRIPDISTGTRFLDHEYWIPVEKQQKS